MKKIFCALVLIPAFSAVAAPIPKFVEDTLKTYQYDNYALREGRLSLTLRKQLVSEDAAYFFFSGICNTIFVHPWEESRITKMDIMNSSQDQGFTFDGGGRECKKSGKMGFDESKAYIESLISKK